MAKSIAGILSRGTMRPVKCTSGLPIAASDASVRVGGRPEPLQLELQLLDELVARVADIDTNTQFARRGAQTEFTVTSVLGHLLESDFEGVYADWNAVDPSQLFHAPIRKSIPQRSRDLGKQLEELARGSSILFIWTDCDREGEAIGGEIEHVCRRVNHRLQVFRARFSAVVAADIHRACQNPVELDTRLVDAVNVRIELDLRIGAALSRFQTKRFRMRHAALHEQRLISYGPCQFPTLGFVVDRFLEIENFKSEKMWRIDVSVTLDNQSVSFQWGRNALYDEIAAIIFYDACVHSPTAHVVRADQRPTTKWRPLPLTTVEMQKAGVRLLRLTSDRTMSIAESLYNRGFVSYPRTETDQFDANFEHRPLIEQQTASQHWGPFARQMLAGNMDPPRQGRSNDGAHPPIHPTGFVGDLQGDEFKVYEFIVRRFLACFSQDGVGAQVNVEIRIADEQFRASGLTVLQRNYLDVYPYDQWSTRTIPNFTQGEEFLPTSIKLGSGQTSPPALLTEADLITLMEMHGIGTDATIHEHIKTVQERGYVVKNRNGSFAPSSLGIALVEGYDAIGLEKSLTKPKLRSELEADLVKVCRGEARKDVVMQHHLECYHNVYMQVQQNVAALDASLSRRLNPPNGLR